MIVLDVSDELLEQIISESVSVGFGDEIKPLPCRMALTLLDHTGSTYKLRVGEFTLCFRSKSVGKIGEALRKGRERFKLKA
jgi:hypothetical protein